ncbi:DUF488 family protein [Candidatus Poriferisocius sp.]|uniref:DUF488 domain-containing protein n=1 Tax=Candidatus Poriferisocius sp. TaxID=3101276 RepID=UPI003B01059D
MAQPPAVSSDDLSGRETAFGDTVIISVGYEGRSVEELVSLLTDNGVNVLVDVRLNAVSRKRGLSKTALGNALNDAGIEYRHERALGNPKDNREPFRNGEERAKNRYRAVLGNGSRPAYDAAIRLSLETRIALLCFERSHESCHRSCITEMVEKHHGISCLAV